MSLQAHDGRSHEARLAAEVARLRARQAGPNLAARCEYLEAEVADLRARLAALQGRDREPTLKALGFGTQEAAIAAMLWERSPRLVAGERLIDRLWGDSPDGANRVSLSHALKGARAKLERLGAPVEALAGSGYRLSTVSAGALERAVEAWERGA